MVKNKTPPIPTRTRVLPKRVPPLPASRAFGQKSPLVDVDLDAFLARCMNVENWSTYSPTDKKKIMETLPASYQPASIAPGLVLPDDTTPDQKPEPVSSSASSSSRTSSDPDAFPMPPLASFDIIIDPYIKRATARFKRDLTDGYYEKAWQDKAKRAHKERMEGKFDAYVRQQAEGMFNTESEGIENHEEDELAQESGDGEYLDTTTARGKKKR